MNRALILPLLFAAILTAELGTVDEVSFQKLVSAHKGKVVLYDFWATWCDGCREELPQLVKLEAKLRGQGFELVTVSADEPEQAAEAAKFLKKTGVESAAYRRQAQDDDHFINSIDPKWSGALPAMFLYDRNAHKVRSYIGQTDIAVLEAAIRRIL